MSTPPPSTPRIADEKYVSLTTYRRSGEAVSTPVWVVGLDDGRIGFWTAMGTGKTKRLRNDPRVVVQACDVRGRITVGSTPQSGTAEMVRSGRAFEEVQHRVRSKYALMTKLTVLTKVFTKLGAQGRKGLTYADTVVLITLA